MMIISLFKSLGGEGVGVIIPRAVKKVRVTAIISGVKLFMGITKSFLRLFGVLKITVMFRARE